MSPVELTDLTLGTHTFEVSAVDEIGQSDPTPATYTWTVVEPAPVDTTAPETTIVSSPEATTTLADATFTFSANETGATFECRLDSTLETDWETDCVSPYLATDLELGPHTFEVRATDLAGNTDATPATHTWTIEADIVAPDTTIISGPSGTNAALDVVFTFTGSDESTDVLELEFECRLDGTDPADWGDCSSPHEIQGLASGEHLFEVRAIDQAGNVDPTPDTRSWTTVDITAPETSIETGPTDPTEATMATFTFSSDEPDSTFECSFDGAGFSNCTSPHELTGVDVGLHTFEVRAVDPAGNTDGTPELYEWTVVSADPPDTTIDSGPVDGTELTTASFLFSSDQAGVAFECALDGEAFSECESPHELDGLSVGTHELMVRAVNAADQVDPTPATYAWTVDAPDPPETTIVLAPPSSTTATSATFTFGSDVLDAGFECSLDGAAFESCESPVEYQGLVFGPHTFEVVATDSTGLADPTPAIHSWVIETPPPACNGSTVTLTANFDAWIDQGSPSSNKGDDSILKVMSKSGANLRALVGFPFPALPDGCIVESAQLTMYAASSASGRTIQALPIAGSWTESGVTWNNQPGTTGTAATTASASGIRTWDVTSQVQVMYDSSALHGFLIRDAVESQDHEQQFHATEKNENPPRIVVTFGPAPEPDTTPPETSTPTGPESPTTSTSATFDLGGTDNETSSYNLSYECSLDGSGFEPCDSPVTYNGLAVGDHTFVVLAVDEAGNADASPEAYQWTIGSPPADTEAPDTAIESGPEATTTATDATFTFSSSETDATFECSLDGAPYAVCASPTDVAGMTIGVHLLEVRAIDSAGNTDASPASYSWAVEPVPSCVPATVVAGADADSWILQDSSRQNYGTDSVLKVDSKNNANARALVRFALPAIPEGCQIQSATLRLYAGSYKDGRTLTATRISASWSESNVTWSNRPGTGGPSATTSSGSGWREWSVTSQVQAMYSGSNRGFMIADANENGGGFDQGLHSREKGTDNPPSLELVFG
jgi:hypothetical protein